MLSQPTILQPVSRKARELFGPKRPVFQLQSTCFDELIFEHVFNVRQIKRTAKFDGLEPGCLEDITGNVAPKIGPKSFRTF